MDRIVPSKVIHDCINADYFYISKEQAAEMNVIFILLFSKKESIF